MTIADIREQKISEDDMKALENLEKGPWPSHITELKKTKYPIEYYAWGVMHKYSPWYSGSFRVRYVFSGILARRSRDGKVSEVHFRTYSPAGRFLSTPYLKKIAYVAENYGIGLLEFAGNTGAIVINIQPDKADQTIDTIRNVLSSDVGGSGDTFREFYACPGPALCEFALYDTLAAMDFFRSHPEIYKFLNNAPRRHRLADLILRRGFRLISDAAKETLPDKPKATPSSHLRFTTGAVLSDDERQTYAEWAKTLVSEYYGGVQ